MAQTAAQETDLMSLVARTWQLDSAVEATLYDFDNKCVAFLTETGKIALAPASDSDSAQKRTRIQADDGRIMISPRTKQIAPLVQVVAPTSDFVSVAPAPNGGFIAAVADGPLITITHDGQAAPLGDEGYSEPAALATSKTGKAIAIAADRLVAVVDAGGSPITSQQLDTPVFDVAFSPDGKRLATTSDDGLSIWRIGQSLERQSHLQPAGEYRQISWSPNGRFVAAALSGGGLQGWRLKDGLPIPMTGYPASSRSVGWGPDEKFLVTSGAYRIVCWPLAESDLDADNDYKPLETGMKGVVLVTAVAAQCKRDLVAGGFGNGIVLICQAGKPDELVVRGAEGQPVGSLAWSQDGLGLAMGAEDGFAAIANFPDFMFK